MGYIRASTANPTGFRPWGAALQPGGLGAFFPNAEAIGFNKVMIDRDAGNPGWKPWGAGSRLAPRIYYPPDARKQYTTPRGDGLGRLGIATVPIGGTYRVVPQYPVSPVVVSAGGTVQTAGGPARAIITWPFRPPTMPVALTPQTGTSSPTLVPNPTPPLPAPTQTQPTMQPPVVPTGTVASTVSPTGTTASGSTVQTPFTSPGNVVPANTPTNSAYTDAAGNIWVYTASTNSWSSTNPSAGVSVAGAVVPSNQAPGTPYTDSSGNVWYYNAASNVWVSATAGGAASSIGNWLTAASFVSGVPNYWFVAGGALALILLMKGKK